MNAEVVVGGERLVLRPDRSLFWPRGRMLVIADPHFGKADAFRSAGIPVPGGIDEPLTRLTLAIAETQATRLTVLGDFWHARLGRTATLLDTLTRWRREHPTLQMDLIRGNHDRAGEPPEGWGEWHATLAEPPFLFAHYPDASENGYVLAGHLHPGIVMMGRGRQSLRLPCFWFGSGVGVLPAFGGFTGSATIPKRPGDAIFAIAGDEVIDVSRC